MDSPPSVDNTVICKDLDWDTDSLGSLCIFRAVGKSIKCPSQEGVSLALTFLLPKNRLRVCCRRVPMYLDHATPWLALAVSRLVSFPRMRSYLGMWAAVLCYLCSPASSSTSFSKSKPVKKEAVQDLLIPEIPGQMLPTLSSDVPASTSPTVHVLAQFPHPIHRSSSFLSLLFSNQGEKGEGGMVKMRRQRWLLLIALLPEATILA